MTMAVAVAAAALAGTSAFAESRPSRETRDRGGWRDSSRNRGETRRDDGRRGDVSRNNRDDSYRRDSSYRGQSRQPYVTRGRVSRVTPYNGGYRVWVGNERYPFFVPSSRYHRDRFRIGVSIQLGGYYNPGGYYDYYDGPYDGYSYSRGDLRGVVEDVDYRRGTFVVRNEATGSFVTVVLRDRGRDRVRAGDYVELAGDWSRSGVFQAYRLDGLDSARYGRY